MIDGKPGKDSVMEAVSTIINFVNTGGGILGWGIVIDWILCKDSMMDAVSKNSNFVITESGIF